MDPHAAPPHAAGPVLTPAQATATDEAWARGQAAAAEDARRCLSCDTSTPFANLDDAIERLLPFHVFGSAEPDEMDEEERAAVGGRLLVSRSEQWEELCRQTEGVLREQLEERRERLRAYTDARAARPLGELREEERLLIAALQHDEVHARVEKGRAANAAKAKAARAAKAAQAAQATAAATVAVPKPPPAAVQKQTAAKQQQEALARAQEAARIASGAAAAAMMAAIGGSRMGLAAAAVRMIPLVPVLPQPMQPPPPAPSPPPQQQAPGPNAMQH